MRRLALLAFFLVAACGSIGVQAQTISLGYKAGDTYKYGFHAVLKYTVAASGMSIPLNLDLSAKENVTVKSVDSDGTADMSVAISDVSMKMTMNGTTNTTTTPAAAGTIDMKVAKDGRVVSVNGNAFGNNALPGAPGMQGGVVSAILPDHPVKPGDKWTKSYDEPNPLGSSSIHATSDNTYLRDDTVDGIKTAVIESKVDTNLDMTLDLGAMLGAPGAASSTGSVAGGVTMTGTAKSDTTTWIDTSARRLVKTHSTGTVDATLKVSAPPGTATTPGISGPIAFKGTQTLDLTPA